MRSGTRCRTVRDTRPLGCAAPSCQPFRSVAGWLRSCSSGLVLNFTGLAWLALPLLGIGAVFALITLPVEFNASRRGWQRLADLSLGRRAGAPRGAKAVSDAAALTYVAALVQALADYALLRHATHGRLPPAEAVKTVRSGAGRASW